MRVWIRRVAIAVGALLLLWALAWLGGPPLLKSQAQTRLSELLGRSVTIGAVELEPWSLDLTVRDVAVGPAPGSADTTPQLQLGRLHVDLSGASLWRGAPVVEALELDAPRIRVARTADGHYDIDDLIAKFAAAPASPPSAEPTRFALYNVALRDGQLLFDDKPAGRQHRLEALNVGLPFLSNLPAQVDVTVEPRVAFRFNGTPFDSGAQATPFAKNRSADLKLAMGELDLLPYKPYLPASLPVRLERGAVSADIALQFAQPEGGAPRLSVKGSAALRGLALADATGAPLAAWDRLRIEVKDVQPLARQVALGRIVLDAPRLSVARDAKGELNLARLGSGNAAAAPSAPARAPAAGGDGWKASVEGVEITAGQVAWADATTAPAAALRLDGIALKLGALRWPEPAAVPLDLAATLHAGEGAGAVGTLTAKGEANDKAARLALGLDALALDALAPYLRQALVPQLAGTLSATAELAWTGGDKPALDLKLPQAMLAGLRLVDAKLGKSGELASIKELSVKDVALDLDGRQVAIGSLRLAQPSIGLSRDKAGVLNVQQWLVAAPAAKGPPPKAAPAGEPWRIQLRDALLDGGQVRFADAMAGTPQPLRVDVSGLRLALQNLSIKGDRTTAPARVQLAAKLGAPAGGDRSVPPALLDWKGQLGLQPLLVKGTAKIDRFPVHLFEPYFGANLGVGLLRADASWQGDVSVAQQGAAWVVDAAGDARVSDLNVHTKPTSPGGPTDELLTWQALTLKGLKVALPAQGRPSLEVGEAALTDFYSKLVITEQGRFNLQDVAADAASAPAPAPAEAASAASAPAPAASAAAVAAAPPPFSLRLGATQLTNGKVDFTDRFVRPNYSAALTELNGRLGAFNNESRDMATLELRGKAAGTAPLEIAGALNPTAKPLALDIQAKATDLELAPLSPYAGKYAGYAIERGKLSMEVAYKIDADGKLDAKNQVILNQLTFGDKVESPEATKLPVLLAVALLKDRHGVIDINLPVSGSINDPKFSVGGIIVKVIFNLLAKALTAPFSLLFGGGADEASVVDFKPGAPVIADSGAKAIEKVAKALTDRPALKMTVTGAADPASEREAYQAAMLEARLLAERRKEMLREGGAADAPVTMSAEDRARLLKEIYKASDVPNKPRNAIGMLKDLPPAEMEAMLKARTLVTEDAMRELALQRGLAVRDALIAKGLPSERLFLAAPKLRASGEGDGWTPRVQLALSTQ